MARFWQFDICMKQLKLDLHLGSDHLNGSISLNFLFFLCPLLVLFLWLNNVVLTSHYFDAYFKREHLMRRFPVKEKINVGEI